MKTLNPFFGLRVVVVVSAACCAATLLALSACTTPGAVSTQVSTSVSRERIAEIVASPDRSTADRNNDLRRRPESLLTFIAPRPGMTVLDLSAGGGYTTELLARAIAPMGRAYGQSQPPRAPDAPARPAVAPEGNASPQLAAPIVPASAPALRRTSAQAVAERAKSANLPNLFAVVRTFEDPVPPELVGNLDLVTLMFNYHDLGHMGTDRTRMNASVFAALKPGGTYVIADHAGRPGTGISEAGTLHRVEEDFVRKEVEAAGFKLMAQGDFLRNPADPRDKNTPDPAQPKDEFVLQFIKP